MENNYKTLRMPELKALAREHGLRGYSQLRKADLIAFLQNNERRAQMSTWKPQREPQSEAQTTLYNVCAVLWGCSVPWEC